MGFKEIYLPLLILITLLTFIKARRKLGFSFSVIFILYLSFNLIVEIVSGIAYYNKINNIVIYNVDILIEGLVFCYGFYYFHSNVKIKKSLLISASVFVLFWALNFFFIQSDNIFNTYSYLLSCIILSLFSLITIYIFVFENIFKDPFKNFFFWISIGVLFCYLGNIPYLMFYNILLHRASAVAYSLVIISQIVNSILYVMIIIGTLYHNRIVQSEE
jgi:hypothetical protein